MIGIVYSQKTKNFLDRRFPTRDDKLWYQEGSEKALKEAGIPFASIYDTEWLKSGALDRCSALFMENILCVDDEEIQLLKNYHAKGGGIVAMFGTSVRYGDGKIRPNYGLGEEFHLSCISDLRTDQWNEQPFGYIKVIKEHPVTQGIKIGKSLMYSKILQPIWAPRLTVNTGANVLANLCDFVNEELNLAAITVTENNNNRIVYSGPSLSYRICQKQIPQDTDDLKKLIVNACLWASKMI